MLLLYSYIFSQSCVTILILVEGSLQSESEAGKVVELNKVTILILVEGSLQ